MNISYNGVDMETVANVKIEDIRVSSIALSPTTSNRPISAGELFVRNKQGKRTVSVTFALLDNGIATRQAALRAINAWAKTDKEYAIEVVGHTGLYLTGVCTAKPDPSIRQWWESKLRIVFTCYDNPFWTSKTEKTATCGTEFTVLGDAPPLMKITKTRAADASDVTYSNGTKTLRFYSIPAGDMEIDLNAETAQVDGSSIMAQYNPVSRWFTPAVGTQTITGDGTIKYRERYE